MQNIIRQSALVGPDTPERVSPPKALPALAARGLKLVGLSDAGRGYHMSRPRPPFGHLLVTTGGSGMVWIDGHWVESGKGTAYLSPPNAPSAFETRANRRWQFAWVFLQEVAGSQVELPAKGASVLIEADGSLLAAAIEGLYCEGIGRADKQLLDQWAQLIVEYCKRIAEPCVLNDTDPLASVWVEVDTRLAAPWSIAGLADLAGVSGESLRKICLAHHGRSPMQQVTHLRMRRADILLRTTSAKLAMIARMVGYENVFAFSTAFRRSYGAPPSLRRNHNGSLDQ